MTKINSENLNKLFESETVVDKEAGMYSYSTDLRNLIAEFSAWFYDETFFFNLKDKSGDYLIFDISVKYPDSIEIGINEIKAYKDSDKPALTFQVKPTPSLKMKI